MEGGKHFNTVFQISRNRRVDTYPETVQINYAALINIDYEQQARQTFIFGPDGLSQVKEQGMLHLCSTIISGNIRHKTDVRPLAECDEGPSIAIMQASKQSASGVYPLRHSSSQFCLHCGTSLFPSFSKFQTARQDRTPSRIST